MTREQLISTESADSILAKIGEHEGVQAMTRFNEALLTRPMTRQQRAVFAASIHEFNRNTASGIGVLAGRWTHHLMDTYSPSEATEKGGLLLSAAFDEFGFESGGRGKNHALILREFTQHLGVSQEELMNKDLIVLGAAQLSSHIWDVYTSGDLDFAIALHAASETTAPPEFAGWKEGFLRFPEYGFDEQSDAFRYIREHASIEVDHAAFGQQALREHLALPSADFGRALQGATSYLDHYGRMAIELTERIFPEVSTT